MATFTSHELEFPDYATQFTVPVNTKYNVS